MNKLTKEDLQAEKIVEAYKKTGIVPIRHMFKVVKKNCGCALTAVTMNKLNMKLHEVDITNNIYHGSELRESELDAFYKGFDGNLSSDMYEAEFHELGVKAAEAVIKEFGQFKALDDIPLVKLI